MKELKAADALRRKVLKAAVKAAEKAAKNKRRHSLVSAESTSGPDRRHASGNREQR